MASADGNEVSGFGFKGCGVWGQSLRAVILNDNEDVVEVESFGFQAWGNPFRALQSLQALSGLLFQAHSTKDLVGPTHQ